MGHLGARASALLDGQLPPEVAERAWEHVHGCHACRDLVEREGWVKSRLAGLSFEVAAPSTPAGLKGSLLGAPDGPPGDAYLVMGPIAGAVGHRRRNASLVATGGAVGAAMVGVLALWAAPADAPTIDRRPPTTSITNTDAPRTPAPSPSTPVAWTRRDHTR